MRFSTSSVAKRFLKLGGLAALAFGGVPKAGAQTTPTSPPTPNYIWNNFISSGTQWSVPGDWSPAGPPTSSTDQTLGFGSSPLQTVTGYTTTNTLGTFLLNSMVFTANSNVSGGVTVTNSATTDTLAFSTSSANVLPSIWQMGTSRIAFNDANTGSYGITLAGGTAAGTTLNVLGSGTGDIYLNTGIAQTGAGNSGLSINETGTRNFYTGSQIRLGGSNSNYTGGVNLISGNLVLSDVSNTGAINLTASVAATPIASLGTGTLTVSGGSIQFDTLAVSSGASPSGITGTLQVNNPIVLNSTLTLTGSAPATAPSGSIVGIFAGGITGSGGITVAPVNGAVNYAFTGANTFTGPVLIQPIGNTSATVYLGTANVSTGTFAGTTNITVGVNGVLVLNNVFGVQTRLNTTTPPALNLNHSTFALYGNPSASAAETLGTLTANGFGTLIIYSGSPTSQTSTLTFGGLNRGADGRGTLSILGTNFGSGTGAGEGILVFSSDPGGETGVAGTAGSVTRGILPYAIANSQPVYSSINSTLSPAGTTLNVNYIPTATSYTALGFVRYDTATGRVVPLNLATEYASNLFVTGTAAPTANLRLASTSAAPLAYGVAGLDTATTVSALDLDTNTAATAPIGLSVGGAGVLTVGGGAILVASNGNTGTGTISNPSLLNLGGLNFGTATAYIQTNSSLVVNAPITGSGGLVKSLSGTLQLDGNDTFTGGLNIQSGPVQFTSDANLGASGQPVTLNSGLSTALVFQPTNLFGPANTGSVTVNRPFTVGLGGGVISTTLANDSLTLSGTIGGSGQLFKVGAGILSLTGSNASFSGNIVAFAGILTASSDATLGTGSLILAGGTFQPAGTLASTNRDVLITATSTIFTGGQNLTINGNITNQNVPGTYTLFKAGTGNLTLTAANSFTGAFQLGESTPTIRATAATAAQTPGQLTLSGPNGAIASASSVFSIAGGEIVLDNTASANQNRLGNVTLSLIGGNATLMGNAATPINEQIGALSINNANNQYGGRLTLLAPAGSTGVTTLTTTAAFSTQAAPNVGTLFVRGTNLGAGGAGSTALIFPTNPTQSSGLIPSILTAATDSAADPTGFATTSTITNAAPNSNQYLLIPLPLASYTASTGALLAGNSALTYDASGPVVFAGSSAANAIRINAGASIDLAAGTLTLSSGDILTTGGTNLGILSTGGTGTLAYGAAVTARFSVAAGSDLTVNANITGTTGGLNKLGGGVFTLNGTVTTTTGLIGISAGTLRYGVANVLPATTQPFINAGAVLDINSTASTLGGLIGWGDTNIGTGTLTLNVTTAPILAYAGGFVGSGTLIKTGTATQILAGNSPNFSGSVQVTGGTNTGTQSAGLLIYSTGALGTGTSPILLGDVTGTVQATLILGPAVSAFNRDITVQAGSAPTTPHTFGVGASTTAIASNFILNQNLRITNTSGNTGNAILNGVVSGVGNLDIFFGSWTFNGNNTFSGGTTVDSGATAAIGVGADTGFGTGAISFTTAGGYLRADGGTRTLGNAIVLASGANFGVAGTNPLVLSGGISLSGASAAQPFYIQNTATTTISGAITNGSGGITKNGPGVLVLTNTNTYTGTTTVNAGTLLVNGAIGLIPGAVTVNSGAIFGGTGSASGTVTLAAGAVLSPGASGSGTLTLAAGLTTVANSILSFRLTDASTAGAIGTGNSSLGTVPNPTSNTYVNVTGGPANIDPGTVVSVVGTGLTFSQPSYSYKVGQVVGTDESGLSITSPSQFYGVGVTLYNPSLTGDPTGAIYLNFSPVPEPASLLALGGAALGAVGFVRRRRLSARS